jgi:hypothetical protein
MFTKTLLATLLSLSSIDSTGSAFTAPSDIEDGAYVTYYTLNSTAVTKNATGKSTLSTREIHNVHGARPLTKRYSIPASGCSSALNMNHGDTDYSVQALKS